uniref:NADH-ubiquinone oxidoreductase chain 2 n=1 Tax=Xenoturbella bocki TaxID=242395 RepID=A7DVT9_XENBC|nr:NADH dehydrogenase subunit 2 [Xenoturbella bocki]
MMKKLSLMMIFLSVGINLFGLMLITLSNHYILMFVGLELMTFSFITMISPTSPRQVEAAVKYFIVQSTASIILLLSLIFPNTQISLVLMMMLMMALSMKLAAAPFHSWFPEVVQGVKWKPAMIILTWQKLGALVMMSRLMTQDNKMVMIAVALISASLGAISGLNQVQTRKIMAYSSISHMGWTIMLLTINQPLALTYFIIYSLITASTMLTMEYHNSNHLSKMHLDSFLSPWTLAMMLSLILSLGGLPPLGGFLNKLLAFKEMMVYNMGMTAAILILSSLMSLFFYLRVSYSTTLTSSSQHSISFMAMRIKKKTFKNMLINQPPLTMMITSSHIVPILGLMFLPAMMVSLMTMTS